MKKILIILLLLLNTMLFGEFKILEHSNEHIIVKYTPDDTTSSKAIIIPYKADYTLNVNPSYIKNRVASKDAFIGNRRIIILRALNIPYTLNISFDNIHVNNGIINNKNEAVDYFILNKSYIGKFLKPKERIYTKSSISGQGIIKFLVDKKGIYRVYFNEIQNYSPIDLSGINVNTIQLFNNGREIPIYIGGDEDGTFDNGDYIEFVGDRKYGKATYFDRYNLYNVYILTVNGNAGARYVIYNYDSNDTIDLSINKTTQTYHFEFDSVYIRFQDYNADTNDFWFYKYLSESDTFYNKYLKTVYNTDNSINLRIMFHGLSRLSSISPDHPVDIYVNDSMIASINWDNQTPYLFEQNGIKTNTIEDSVKVSIHVKYIPGDTSTIDTTISNTVLLNWMEIDYIKELKTDSNFINFRIDNSYGYGLFEIRVLGFHTNKVIIYKDNVKRIENYHYELDSLTNTYTIVFRDKIFSNNRDYSIYANTELLKPVSIDTFRFANLSSNNNMGKTIFIIPQKYKNHIEDLKEHFENNSILIAGTEEIYNEFSNGFISPNGIRDFIKTAYNNWNITPTHVLLIGDASKDENNHFGLKDIYIPTTHIYKVPAFGTTATDYFYTRIVGDDYLSDISVSRFPAENENDINTLKSKIINYNDYRNQGVFNLRAIMAYDTVEYIESKIHSQNIAQLLPSYMYPDFMHTFEDWSGDFLYEINQGASLLNILSHGANKEIGYGPFFRIYDILKLHNMNRLPFVSVYSCNTNEYNMIGENEISIGEAFVLAPFGGAIAYYGATAVSEKLKNYTLSQYIYKQILKRNIKNIGELERIGELDYFFNSTNIDPYNPYNPDIIQIMNYSLLGINFLNLPIPELSDKTLSLSSEILSPKDTLIITLNDTLFNSGTMESVLLNNKNKPLAFDNASIFNGTGHNTIIIPDSVEIGNLNLITIAMSSDTAVMYVSYPSIGNVALQSFDLLPQYPDTNEYFRIYAKINNSKALKNLYAMGSKYNTNNFYVYNMIRDTIDTTLYYTDVEISPLNAENREYNYYYKIQFTDTLDNVYNSTVKSFFRKALPDLIIDTMSIKVISKNRKPFIQTKLYNKNEYSISNVEINYTGFNDDSIYLGLDTLSVSKLFVYSDINLKETYFLKDLILSIDPNNAIRESNENNNRFIKNDFNWLIIPFNSNSVNDTSIVYENMHANIRPQSDNIGAFIAFNRQIIDSTPFIDNYTYTSEHNAYKYIILNGDTNSIDISILFKEDSLTDMVSLFLYNDSTIELINENINDSVNVILKPGYNEFVIGMYNDTIKPNIDIFIENKDYINNVILSAECNLSIIIEDNTGININNTVVVLNNDTLSDEQYVLYEKNTSDIIIKIKKELEDGLYTLSVSAEDIFKNTNQATLDFRTTTQLAITEIGSFPNPAMSDNVEIACRLTENADELKLYVFNSNGVLINRVDMGPALRGVNHYNYNINNLPNGTYFYYFEAIKDNEIVKSKIEKMSVLK